LIKYLFTAHRRVVPGILFLLLTLMVYLSCGANSNPVPATGSVTLVHELADIPFGAIIGAAVSV
jgi:hypothetical protein